MSIVVAVFKAGRTAMAADTRSNFGAEILPPDNQTTRKIRRVGGALLGRSGWGVYDNILGDLLEQREPPELDSAPQVFRFFNELWKVLHSRYAFVNNQAKRKDSPFGDLGGSFLVAGPGGIHYVAPNLGVTRFEKYYAIGSGAHYSLGAIHRSYDRDEDAASLARAAVETAIAFNVNCGGPVDLLEVP